MSHVILRFTPCSVYFDGNCQNDNNKILSSIADIANGAAAVVAQLFLQCKVLDIHRLCERNEDE